MIMRVNERLWKPNHAIAPLSLYQLDQTSKQPPQHTMTMLGIRAISLTDLSLSGFPFPHTHRQQQARLARKASNVPASKQAFHLCSDHHHHHHHHPTKQAAATPRTRP